MCGKSQHHLGALCSHFFFFILTATFNINPFHWFTTHQNFHKTDKTFVFTFSKHFSEQNNKQHKKMPRKAMKCIVEVDLHVVSMAWSMYFSIYLLIISGRLLSLLQFQVPYLMVWKQYPPPMCLVSNCVSKFSFTFNLDNLSWNVFTWLWICLLTHGDAWSGSKN